ncbi:hypothetical protein 8F11_90 [uncultured Caudovirales phage]|uniref:Uncharacterized protein n=1 Tax=uncultured Caudovirales phage TaxID=2100421 RepID=A0A2H4IZT3_9CAUD|nr:hypothetical protein 8F11_90 [uncultured Caudovirales phage]
MTDIARNQSHIHQTSCDHVFSFVSQDGVHIFKCESCGAEHEFIGDSKTEQHEA